MDRISFAGKFIACLLQVLNYYTIINTGPVKFKKNICNNFYLRDKLNG